MAALVTLEQAKDQLNVTATDKDALIQRKIETASAIILDYLKNRAHEPYRATITSASVASPTVITTAADHAFANGSTVVITGDVTGTPRINGSWVVSAATINTFTIPLAVTVASTGASAYVAWDENTVPGHVYEATMLMLTHLYEHRGDDMKADAELWQAIDRLLVRSRDPAFA